MNWINLRLVLTAGFALFAMFFGSGNLLYPLAVGVLSGDGFPYALVGLLTTGVAIPFLGLIATMVSSKNKEDFFAPLPRPVGLSMSLLTLSLMGPFGVGPRCVLVASSGISLLLPQVPVQVLGFCFIVVCGFLLLRAGHVIQVIGRWLTPLLLLGLLTIIFASLRSLGTPMEMSLSPLENLKLGGLQGYQMMDLLAAIFFGRSIYNYLQLSLKKHIPKQSYRLSLLAGLLGAGMLAALYTGLVAIGAHHALELSQVDPEQRLATIANRVLGSMALGVTSLVIALACLTTLCVLMELFADFLRLKLLPNTLNRTYSILLTLFITFVVSLAGFFTLASWIEMTLSFIYPGLITFSILRILEATGYLSKKKLQILSGIALCLCFLFFL